MYNTKYQWIEKDLYKEEAELDFNGFIFTIKFQIDNYRCVFDSMRFEYWDDDLCELVPIEPNDFEKFGLDRKMLLEIEEDINLEIENWYYERYDVDPDENIDDYLEQKQKSINY